MYLGAFSFPTQEAYELSSDLSEQISIKPEEIKAPSGKELGFVSSRIEGSSIIYSFYEQPENSTYKPSLGDCRVTCAYEKPPKDATALAIQKDENIVPYESPSGTVKFFVPTRYTVSGAFSMLSAASVTANWIFRFIAFFFFFFPLLTLPWLVKFIRGSFPLLKVIPERKNF
ncbi:MAG: hypothetical protein GX221_00350 [Candidatus Riflebacteria bacterium]|nr:hypothetical protein [Candidatus Riflebacteria bacterium]